MGQIITVIFRKPVVLLLMAVFMGENFVATIFLTWTPTFLVEKFHFDLAKAALWATAFINLAGAGYPRRRSRLPDYATAETART